jgi:cyclopropane fatty-acyl-phospholipid synthase-like methyltransferase
MADLNRYQIIEFWKERAKLANPKSTRFHPQHTEYDLAGLRPLCRPGIKVLDLGCGQCALLNRLVSEADVTIHGVDIIPEFLAHAAIDRRITTEVADAVTYQSGTLYDLIILAGLVNYVPASFERDLLYERVTSMLKANGVLFLKSQFGTRSGVDVDAWSEALGFHYRAHYPFIDAEISRLNKWFNVEVRDAYPPELNPHTNTRFFHLICRPGGGS